MPRLLEVNQHFLYSLKTKDNAVLGPRAAAGFLERLASNGGPRPHSALASIAQQPMKAQQNVGHGSAPADYFHLPPSQPFPQRVNKDRRKDGQKGKTGNEGAAKRRGKLNLTFQ